VISSDKSALLIETERLILRPMALSDVDDLLEYQSHPEIVRYIPWPERTREQVIEAAEKTIATGKFDLKEEGDYIVLVWELKSSRESDFSEPEISSAKPKSSRKVIGQSNMGIRSLRDQCADIGWVTHQDFQRQGYAFEATHALMHYAFNNFELHRIVADIDTRNPESAAMAEKLGMRREGEFKDSEFFKGDWCSMWLYAILKSEFKLP
jgi:RimJ/RimL family protein N-acetyltransferase